MSDWPLRPLGELVSLEYGKALKANDRTETGEYSVYGSNGIVGTHCEAIVKHPTIVVGRKGAVGEAHLAWDGCWPIDTAFYAVVLKPDMVCLRYLHYWFTSLDLKSMAITATVPGLSRPTLYSLPVPVPPLAEQERIVKLLDEAEAIRKLRSQADQRTADLIPALFHEMFGDPVTNPMGWPLLKLPDLCVADAGIKAGPFGSSLTKPMYTVEGPRIYGQQQVISGKFTIGDYHISETKFDEMSAYAVAPGDILISLVGTIGRIAIVPEPIEPGIINPRLVRIRLDLSRLNPFYLSSVLTSHSYKQHLGRVANGGTMGVLNATLLKQLNIPAPPLAIQNEFETRINEMQSIQLAQQRNWYSTETMFEAVLENAFP